MTFGTFDGHGSYKKNTRKRIDKTNFVRENVVSICKVFSPVLAVAWT